MAALIHDQKAIVQLLLGPTVRSPLLFPLFRANLTSGKVECHFM